MAIPGNMTPEERRLADTLHKAAYLGIEYGVTSEATVGALVSVIAALINTQFPAEDHDQIMQDVGKALKNAASGFAIYAAERRRREQH